VEGGMDVKINHKKLHGVERRWLIAALLSVFCYPINSLADCPSPLKPSEIPSSDLVREFYADMCRESNVPLVFAGDPGVKSRLQIPSGGHRLTEDDIYPDRARHLGFEGPVAVAFVVEPDGTVQHSKIVQSSGHQLLDYAEWMYWKQYKFDSPGRLDGAPARVLVVERMNFKLKGGPGLPPSFSDSAVDNLALRILEPYTSRDSGALFQAIDETAKSNITLSKIQERFTRYGKQYGAVSYLYYKGLLSVKNVHDVPQYRLWYLVRAAAPDNGAAALIVTAVDRKSSLGITDFEFEPSPIRLNIR
jgi:TonB family protein